MSKKTILIKPVVSEKAELLSDEGSQYTFVVAKAANKIEIAEAIADQYGVTVARVNTAIMPGKTKNRSTKSGVLRGRVSSYKKAIVTLAGGDTIDLYNEL